MIAQYVAVFIFVFIAALVSVLLCCSSWRRFMMRNMGRQVGSGMVPGPTGQLRGDRSDPPPTYAIYLAPANTEDGNEVKWEDIMVHIRSNLLCFSLHEAIIL